MESVEFPIVFDTSIGEGNATHPGRFTWILDVEINISDPELSTATGTGVLRAANGYSLFTEFTAFAIVAASNYAHDLHVWDLRASPSPDLISGAREGLEEPLDMNALA